MSQLVTTPAFDSGCPGTAVSIDMTSNPNLFYDITNGTPSTIGTVPPDPSLGCTAFELNGHGPIFVWNPLTASWSAN
jgi:hypothetical protein